MAIERKPNPVNEDEAIDKIQVALYNGLVTNGTWTNYESYHRAYKNETPEGIRPEIFRGTAKGSDYWDSFMNDDFNATSFFLVDTPISVENGMHTANISIIFQVNLEKLYPPAPHLFDAEMHMQIEAILSKLDGTFTYIDTYTSINEVYDGLDTSKVQWDDMQKFHVVRFEIEAKYVGKVCSVFASKDCAIAVTASAEPETSLGANNGTATANDTGGQGNITYLWTTLNGNIPSGQEENKTITGLIVGVYTVLVTDDNVLIPVCSATSSTTVNAGAPLPSCDLEIFEITNTPPDAFGGSNGTATITTSDNVGAVSVIWDNGQTTPTATGLSAGTICVSVLDLGVLGCHKVGDTTISQGISIPPFELDFGAWWDFADTSSITDSGGAVSQTDDKSGNGNHLVQTTAVRKPTTGANTINGLNVVTWDGSDSLNALLLTLGSEFTMFVVSKSNNLFIEHSESANSNDGFFMYGVGSPPAQIRRGANSAAVASNPSWIGANPAISFIRNTGTVLDYGRNNISLGSVSSAAVGVSDAIQTLFVGSRNNSGVFMTGDIGEIILYRKALSDVEMLSPPAYFTAKWGIL